MDVFIGIALTLLFFWNIFNTLYTNGLLKMMSKGADLTEKFMNATIKSNDELEGRIAKLEERADKMGSGLNSLSVEMQSRTLCRKV